MHHELRSPDDARAFLVQGLHLQRLRPARPDTVRPALEWALEIAADGQPLPPVGFVADLGFAALGQDRETRQTPTGSIHPPPVIVKKPSDAAACLRREYLSLPRPEAPAPARLVQR